MRRVFGKVFRKALAVLLVWGMVFSTGSIGVSAEESGEGKAAAVTGIRSVSGGDGLPEEETGEGWDGITREAVFEGDSFRILFYLTQYWEGGYQADITLENTGDAEIGSWCLEIPCKDRITDIWNGRIQEETEEGYLIRHAGWNRDIPAGGCVSFGYTAVGSFPGFPEKYTLLGEHTETYGGDCEITYCLERDWGNGFTGSISITNRSDAAIEDWVLEFDFGREITNLWNGTIKGKEGDRYTVRNAGYNETIEPGGTVSFGFTGEGGTPEDEPCRYKLESLRVRQKRMEDYKTLRAYGALEIGYQGWDSKESVTENLVLPVQSEGIAVKWRSSDPRLVSAEGIVNRPAEESADVVLTAVVGSGESSCEKVFRVRVIKSRYEAMDPVQVEDHADLEYLYLYNEGGEESWGVYLNEEGKAEFIDGCFTDMQVESPREALLALQGIRGMLGSVSPVEELEWDHTGSDAYGTFFSFRQTCGGVPVYGRSIVVGTDGEGRCVSLNSSYVSGLQVNTVPSLTGEEAEGKAEEKGYSLVCRDALYICVEKDGAHLAWNVYGTDGRGDRYNILVDAHDGAILRENACFSREGMEVPEEEEVSVEAKAKDELKVERTITVVSDSNAESSDMYLMKDNVRRISVHDMRIDVFHRFSYSDMVQVKWGEEWDPAAVSAYANTIQAYDYFLTHFGRQGMNNNTRKGNTKESTNGNSDDDNFMRVGIHYSESNSYYSEGNIYFGEGGQYLSSGAATLDVVAHEFTHGVMDTETGLGSQCGGAAGAINEGYADIFGCLVKGEQNNWKFQEGNYTKGDALRNIANPEENENPAKIGDSNYADYTKYEEYNDYNDYGKVHKNSTIVSHACYLMWKKGISDWNVLETLWYHSIFYGYDETSDFRSVRRNVLASAKAMHMSADQMRIIREAFDGVGISGDNVAEIIGSNVLTGKVAASDRRDGEGNGIPIGGAAVTVKRKGASLTGGDAVPRRVGTDGSGMFYLAELTPGDYEIHVEAAGYMQETRTMEIKGIGEDCSAGVIELIPGGTVRYGRDSGSIVDSNTKVGIEGLSLYFRRGKETKEGDVVCLVKTGKGGHYTTPFVPVGDYCVEVRDERPLEGDVWFNYNSGYFEITITEEGSRHPLISGGAFIRR